MSDRTVTVHLPRDCADQLTGIAEREGRTLAGELLWLALKRVRRKAARSTGRNDDETRVVVRMPRELADKLRALAEQRERTIGAEVRHLIREHIESTPDAPTETPDF